MKISTIPKKNKHINVNDIIEVSMSMEQDIPEEDLKNTDTIDAGKYDTKCNVSYHHPNAAGWTNVDYVDKTGYSSYFDIKDYLEDRIQEDIDYLADYEIFDVDNKDGSYQTAKIKIKAIKKN